MSKVTDLSCEGIVQNMLVASVAIEPGMLVERYNGGIRPHASAGADCMKLFAENSLDGQTMRDGEYAINDLVYFKQFEEGAVVNALLVHGANGNASIDAPLYSNGNGYLKATSGTVAAVAASIATGTVVANTGITYTAKRAGEVGNDLRIALIDPAGNTQALSVFVEGTEIQVSLATDGSGVITSTAALVIAAINADTAASELITAANTGASTGEGVVAAVASTSLAGGADAVAAGTPVAYAYEAVNNSAGSAAVDIKIRVK